MYMLLSHTCLIPQRHTQNISKWSAKRGCTNANDHVLLLLGLTTQVVLEDAPGSCGITCLHIQHRTRIARYHAVSTGSSSYARRGPWDRAGHSACHQRSLHNDTVHIVGCVFTKILFEHDDADVGRGVLSGEGRMCRLGCHDSYFSSPFHLSLQAPTHPLLE